MSLLNYENIWRKTRYYLYSNLTNDFPQDLEKTAINYVELPQAIWKNNKELRINLAAFLNAPLHNYQWKLY